MSWLSPLVPEAGRGRGAGAPPHPQPLAPEAGERGEEQAVLSSPSRSSLMQFSVVGWLAPLIAALLFPVSPQLTAEDWPQFRGPNCSGVSSSKKSLPLHF